MDALQPLECDFKNAILMIGPLTCSMNICISDLQTVQTMKNFSSVSELPSKLISDNFYANFETLLLFSIHYDDCDNDEWAFFFFFLSSVLFFQDKMCIVFKNVHVPVITNHNY